MIKDYFLMALKNIRKRKVRSSLTVLGIFIAIATIFILISLSLGLQKSINEQFQLLGADKFFVQPKGQLGGPGSGGAVSLTTDDVKVIEKVSGVNEVTYAKMKSAKIEFAGQTRYFFVAGISLKNNLYIETGNLKADEGKLIDKEGVVKEVMIGSDYKYANVFKKPVNAGDKISINGQIFTVKGIVAEIGNPSDDRNIYMSIEDLNAIYGVDNKVDSIVVQIKQGENIENIANKTEKALIKSRGLTKNNEDFSILTPEELLGSVNVVLSVITGFLLAVASISLLVGGIGIANTMYTSVLERTREIGIMKAIGAKNSDILKIFLIEAGIIGLIGGIIGTGLGFGAAKLIELIIVQNYHITLLKISTPFYLFLGCLSFAFFIGVLSGLLPARRALKINTVEALRYE